MAHVAKPKPRPITKPKAPTLMIAKTTYFGPARLVVTEGTIVEAGHPEPTARPAHWQPVAPVAA